MLFLKGIFLGQVKRRKGDMKLYRQQPYYYHGDRSNDVNHILRHSQFIEKDKGEASYNTGGSVDLFSKDHRDLVT